MRQAIFALTNLSHINLTVRQVILALTNPSHINLTVRQAIFALTNLSHINLTVRQVIFALTNLCCVLSGEVTNTSLSLCLEVQTMMEWQDIFWL